MHGRILAPAALALMIIGSGSPPVSAQDTEGIDVRLDRLERENAELRAAIDAVAGQMEQLQFRDVLEPVGESRFGMGPAASKVYERQQGLSIGGYGEGIYQSYSGGKSSTADFLRGILYTGYKFDDRWVFNSELEIEHASTDRSGSVSLEFAYLEYLHSERLAFRAGLLLTPMGLVNEMHEPTTFYGASRPELESRILPSTWRENGLGVHGDVSDFSYKLFLMTGLDGSGFDEAGLRGGRQKGSKAKAESLAVTGRLDWSGLPGLVAGVSAWVGDSGQDTTGLGRMRTTILDAHAEYRWRGLRLRGLYAQARVQDTIDLFNRTSAAGDPTVVGKEMRGFYGEAGYDVMEFLAPSSRHQLVPFVRWEELDTHAEVASTLARDRDQDERILSVGVNWLPIENIVFKVDFQDFDRGADRFELSLGYVF